MKNEKIVADFIVGNFATKNEEFIAQCNTSMTVTTERAWRCTRNLRPGFIFLRKLKPFTKFH
jgi:hypothetical protein